MVLAILLVAGALVAAFVLRSREIANKTLCASNLRQLCIAAHNYHNDFSKLPVGYYGPFRGNGNSTNVVIGDSLDRGPWVGCLGPLTPYLGYSRGEFYYTAWKSERVWPPPTAENPQNGPSQKWSCGLQEERKAWWSLPQNIDAGTMRFKDFLCPSDHVDEPTSAGVLFTVHVANGSFQMLRGSGSLGRTSYAGVAGTVGDFDLGVNRDFGNPQADFGPWIGSLYNRSTLTLGQINVQDGTSNTLLFGESLGGSVVNGRDLAWSWFGVGAMGTAYGLGRANVPAPIDPPPLGSVPPSGQDGAAWYRFSSRHPHVVQFCLADCSTIALRYGKTTIPDLSGDPPGNNSSDWALLQQLAGRKDGFKNDIANLLEEGSTLK
jgi:hypothetical protein